MSLLQEMAYISLTSSKSSAIHMLNAVITCMGSTELIGATDGRDAILKKIEDKYGGLFRISIPDLLDAEAMKDSWLRKKHDDYLALKDTPDEGFEMTTSAKLINILDVIPNADTCEVRFKFNESEDGLVYYDWCNWDDISRFYGCRISADNHLIDKNGHAIIPDGTTEIDPRAFEFCERLASVEIPSTVKVIGYGAFFGCTGLASIVIPDSVEEIQECAFKGCTSLRDVVLPDETDMSFDAFEGCPCEKEIEKRLD